MKVHEKYKTFDVDWIANPRVDWDTKRLKFFIQQVSGGGTPSTGNPEYWSGDIPWVSSKDMKTAIIQDTEEHISERAVEESSTSEIAPGTVLMVARSGILKHTLPVAISAVPLTINQDIKAFTAERTLVPRFLFWRLKGTERDILDICGKVGATVESIDVEALLSLPVSIPGVKEQIAIADHLDKETARIDELVEKKRRLIKLLKEKRLAIINHAVTRGIDPNVKLKPSGIDWLGDIPEHWESKRLKYFIDRVVGGGTPSTGDPSYWNGEVPWVSSKDMKSDLIADTEDHISERAVAESSTNKVRAGTVLIVARSGILKHTLPVAITGLDVTINQDIKALTPGKRLSAKFLFWKLKGLGQDILDICGKAGATVESIEIEDLMSIPFSVPPANEQDQIIDFLDASTQRLDATVAKIEREIGLLNEYRTALISEVVTGKIRVV